MDKFVEKKFFINYKLLLILILIIIAIIILIIRLTNPIYNKVVIDVKLLNSLVEDNNLNESVFVLNGKEREYKKIIDKNIDSIYPKPIADIIKKSKTYKYTFYETYMVINYIITDENVTYNDFYVPIKYDDIKNYINIDYDNTIFQSIDIMPREYEYAISLTFDDGPNGNNTNYILDSLEDYNYNASFFMVGYKLNSDIDTVKRVYNSDSEVGYHTLNHAYLTKQKDDTITKELDKANDILYSIVSDKFHMARPPYGSYNKRVIETLNMPIILWSIDTNDWQHKDVDYLVNYLKDNIKPGAIILMHDSYKTSAQAVPRILKYCYLNHIEVLSVSNLAEKYGIELENKVYSKFN